MAQTYRFLNQQIPEPPDTRCILDPQDNPELSLTLVWALRCCCFGIIYCCFGHCYFKALMFLSGLLSPALVILLLFHKEQVLETQLSLEVSTSITLGPGLFCSLVTMVVCSVGLFLIGLLLGLKLNAGLCQVLNPSISHFHWVLAGGTGGAGTAGSLVHASVARSIHSSGHDSAGCYGAGDLCRLLPGEAGTEKLAGPMLAGTSSLAFFLLV
ncbi:hypothetical protein P7K49_025418 [Saguinus oedipus]|uniref:Transmembrane protein 198 n=1 Tax=Saguinus oedipus TaxID=9490 RepID=A0ABQ9UHU6_SAGOE|nr:hypothetical protein P7K49_025418 [Saguinus oedipus]